MKLPAHNRYDYEAGGQMHSAMGRLVQESGTVPAGSFSMCAAISPGWVNQISSRCCRMCCMARLSSKKGSPSGPSRSRTANLIRLRLATARCRSRNCSKQDLADLQMVQKYWFERTIRRRLRALTS
jgi:hypothetical protein